jgi:hypothetical protein
MDSATNPELLSHMRAIKQHASQGVHFLTVTVHPKSCHIAEGPVGITAPSSNALNSVATPDGVAQHHTPATTLKARLVLQHPPTMR